MKFVKRADHTASGKKRRIGRTVKSRSYRLVTRRGNPYVSISGNAPALVYQEVGRTELEEVMKFVVP
jgi:hypothetical protein